MPSLGSAVLLSEPGQLSPPELRRHLLRLVTPHQADAAAQVPLSPASWAALDGLAAAHRLRPLLHFRHSETTSIPEGIRANWRAARRQGAIDALVAAGELRRALALLDAAGFDAIALKGAWLAWHAYPEPALRPMRDIDLLLTPETVIPAFELLRANGYVTEGAHELSLDDTVRLDKHMPPLFSPNGICFELHQRLWEAHGRMDHAAPTAALPEIRARAVAQGGIRYLAPTDLLGHLVIHATYDHRLDCGPLLLTDISGVLAGSVIDWDRFWADAKRQGWDRGARLVLELVAVFAPDCAISFPAGQAPAPADVVALAPDLLLQDLDTRQSAGVLATARTKGLRGFLQRISGRRHMHDEPSPVHRDLSEEGGYAGWAFSRLMRTLAELSRREVRRQSAGLATLSGWLDSPR